MQKCHYVHRTINTAICAVSLLLGYTTGYAAKPTNNKALEYKLGESIDQLESIIPVIERGKAIDIALPFFNKYPAYTERLLGNAILYFPVIERILDKYQLPADLKYLPLFESSFQVDAVSRAGAKGLWQFMTGTGRKYGLTINSELDERMDYIKATEAAARFLKELYEEFNDWSLVLMAYNGGPYRIKRIIRDHDTHDVQTIMRYMPEESRTYLSKMIAAKLIFHIYKSYGLEPLLPAGEELYLTNKILSSSFDLGEISKKHNISYSLLRAQNPHLRKKVISNTSKTPVRVFIPTYDNTHDEKIAFREVSLYLPDKKRLEALANRINWDIRKIRLYNGHYNHVNPGDHYYTIPVPENEYLSIIKEFGPQPLAYLKQDVSMQKKVLQSKRIFAKYEVHPSKTRQIYYLSPAESLLEVASKLNISLDAIKEMNPNMDLFRSARIYIPKTEQWPIAVDWEKNPGVGYLRSNTGNLHHSKVN